MDKVLKTELTQEAKAVKISKLDMDVKKLEKDLAELKAAHSNTGAVMDPRTLSRRQLARCFVSETGEVAKLNRLAEQRGGLTRLLCKKLSTHKMTLAALEIQYARRLEAGLPLDRNPRSWDL